MKYLLWDNECRGVEPFPNATIAEYGTIEHNEDSVHQIKAEVFARGPVAGKSCNVLRYITVFLEKGVPNLLAATINGKPLHTYDGDFIFNDTSAEKKTSHVVSIVGWGVDEASEQQYWVIRNSWGQYWASMGFGRVKLGSNVLGIEHKIIWAVPGVFSTRNKACHANAKNCPPISQKYTDPSLDVKAVKQRLRR
jgi:cathepsin X